MKSVVIGFACMSFIGLNCWAGDLLSATQKRILKLEKKERMALVNHDIQVLLHQVWSKHLVIQNAANNIVSGESVAAAMSEGVLAYSLLERDIQSVVVNGNVVIVMGAEFIQAQQPSEITELAYSTRFTHIWKIEHSQWRLIGRQATLVN
jgi:hypothetical protein